MGHLSQLQDLEVCCNQLTDLPEEIGELSQLRSLALDCNQITRLPEAIGQLSQLRSLFLTGNQLTQLPQTIGRLSDLRILELNRNLHLVTLPMSLQHLRHLTYLSTEETQIPQEMGEAILAAARGYRGAEAEEAVVDRLAMWNGYSEQSLDCDTLLQSLTGPEKRSLNEWLVRLEQTKEFENRQRPLAMMVCKILASVSSNGEFRESFFAQVNGNLEECADRAAMAFNEIYTAWRCQNPDDGLSLVQGIELYARLAKTLTLRTILQEVCAGRDDLGQSVHIFLKWEVRLRDHLGLITAVQEVRYSGIGIRDWLDEEWIVQEVNKRYQRTLDRLDGFHSYLQRGDPDFRSRYAQLFDHNLSTLEELDRSEMTEQAVREAKDAVMRHFDAEVAQLARVRRTAICHPPLRRQRVVTMARNARPSRSP